MSEFNVRYGQLKKIEQEKTGTTSKPKEPDIPLSSIDKEALKKTLKKEDLINVIMRRLPEAKRGDLEAMSIEDLIAASHELKINLWDLNALKVPKNATKEQKELIQNLEELRREREVQSEFNRLKERVTGEEAMSLEEKKKQLKDASAKIIRKKQQKPTGFKEKVKPKEKLKPFLTFST